MAEFFYYFKLEIVKKEENRFNFVWLVCLCKLMTKGGVRRGANGAEWCYSDVRLVHLLSPPPIKQVPLLYPQVGKSYYARRIPEQYMSAIGAGWLYLGWGALLFHTNYGLMQHSPFEIKERLLKALDKEYNVVDMAAVLEIVTILERTPITKEALETTRLGRDINELRRKTRNESLAKRAKDLVRRWRDLILPQNEVAAPTPVPVAPPVIPSTDTTQQNGSTRIAHPSRSSTAPKLNPISPAISLPNSDKSNISPALSTKVEAVPKTHASNKRLRKESSPQTSSEKKISLESSPELPAKRVRTDNENVENSRLNGDHYDSVGSDCEIVSVTPAQSKIKPRKKTKNRKENPDEVKEKIAKVGKMSKVKTTQELLAGLQKNESINNILVDDDVEKNKTEHIARFLRDESEIIDIENDDTPVEAEPQPPKQELLKTPEEILSRLPPLDLESINWDESPPPSPRAHQVTDEDVDRVLNQQIPGLNGNQDHSFRDENVFREWHQVVSRTSMNSDLLHILPYVVID